MTENENNPTSNPAVWELEKTHPEIVAGVKEKMREVVDPEIGLDIVALGLIRNIRIDEGGVNLSMILTTPFCPYGPAMIEMTKQKAEEAFELPVRIELGLEMWDFSMMEEGAMPEWGMW